MASRPSQAQHVKRSLRLSILEGSACSGMMGLTQDYIAPFALALGASITQIGLLASVPSLCTSVSQLFAPNAAERAGSRKRFMLPLVLAHAIIWIPVLLLPHLSIGNEVWWLILFVTVGGSLSSMVNPAWGSMMADLVPMGQRGRYFGLRGRACGLVALVFFLIGGTVLSFSSRDVFIGFSVVFGAAALLRFVSWYYMSRMYEPPAQRSGREQSLLKIARGMASSNLGRFIVYASLMNLSVSVASPFFAAYMLKDLGFGYLTYVAITAAATLSSLLFLGFWGKRTDMAGNIRILKFTSLLIPLVPVLWIAGNHLYYLALVQVLSGFAWSGFNLASTNFVYDAAAPEHRMRFIALFGAMTGVAMCLGALAGGVVAPHLPPLRGSGLLTLFLISGLMRGSVAALMLRRIAEVRRVPRLSSLQLLLGGPRRGLGRHPAVSMRPLVVPVLAVADANAARVGVKRAWEREQSAASRSPPGQ